MEHGDLHNINISYECIMHQISSLQDLVFKYSHDMKYFQNQATMPWIDMS